MLNVYRPQPLYAEHPHERLIAADVSLKGRRVHLHPPAAYPDFAAPVADLELRVAGRVLPGQSFGSPHPLAYAYDLPTDGAVPDSAQVWLRGVHAGRVRLKNGVPGGRVRLTAATLFKGDYPQLRAWVEHHAALGFERFVLYYNGEAEAILPELSACAPLALHELLLVSWPYSYWVEGTGLGVEGTLAEQGDRTDIARLAARSGTARDWHHAQQMMLDHALVLLRGTTEFVGFFDLDEYFCLPTPGGLPQMLSAGGQDVYIFQSRWAELSDAAVPCWADGGDFLARHPVWAAPDWVPFPGRTKTIARPEVIHGMGAHLPKVTTAGARVARVPPEAGGIYHFHCFSGKASRRALVNPGGQWVPFGGFGGPVPLPKPATGTSQPEDATVASVPSTPTDTSAAAGAPPAAGGLGQPLPQPLPGLERKPFDGLALRQVQGRLELVDFGGWETRNPSTVRLISDALRVAPMPDFGWLLVNTGDRDVPSTCAGHPVMSYSTSTRQFDHACPDFTFDHWKQTQMDDYEATCADLQALGRTPSTTGLLGWRGAATHPSRNVLVALDDKHTIDAEFIRWDRTDPQRLTSPNFLSMADQVRRWRWLIDIEGVGYSGRLKLLFHSGRVVLLQQRPHEEWYFPMLEPWVHYVPVARDLADLPANLSRLRADPALGAAIAAQAQAFAGRELTRAAAQRRWRTLLAQHARTVPSQNGH